MHPQGLYLGAVLGVQEPYWYGPHTMGSLQYISNLFECLHTNFYFPKYGLCMYKNVVFKGLGAVLVPPGTDPHIPHSGLPHPPMIWTLSSIQFFSILTAQIPNLADHLLKCRFYGLEPLRYGISPAYNL